MRLPIAIAAALSCLLPGTAAVANATIPTALAQEFAGVRSQAMGGAHRGVGTSNDTLVMNPAGMAVQRRYSMDAQYNYASKLSLSRYHVSIVDSKSGPVAGGMGYTWERIGEDDRKTSLHRLYLATAYPISQAVALGLSTRHIRGDYRDLNDQEQELSLYSGDLGLSLNFGGGFGVGVVYHNLWRSQKDPLVQPAWAFGASLSLGPLNVAADYYLEDQTGERERRQRFHVGGEFLVKEMYALRAGFKRSPFAETLNAQGDENILSGGLGIVNNAGALDIAYSQSLNRSGQWELTGALKFFM